jgi:hypothetical protein
MSSQRMLGVVLLVVGAVLLVLGLNASDSVADQVSKTFTGRFTKATTWYIVGGGAAALFGAMMLFRGGRGSR